MPRIGLYRSLVCLTGIYSNFKDPFNRKELVFYFFPIHFHILFTKIHRACEIVFCAQSLHFWLQCSFQGCKIRGRQFRNERKKQTGNGLVPLQLRLKSNVDPYNLSEAQRFLQ
jgi:hypothetical protein